jgi:hypothetical protein
MPNKQVILVGGGTSVRDGINTGLWDKIKDQEVWSCNFAYKAMPYLPSKELFVDYGFVKDNQDDLEMLRSSGVEIIAFKHPKFVFRELDKAFTLVDATRELDKITPTCMWYGKGGLTGTFALSVAIQRGFDEIYLLGYDFGTTDVNNKDTHFYQGQIKVESFGVGHPHLYRDIKTNKVLDQVTDYQYFMGSTARIYNVSPQTNIPYLPKIDYETFYKKLLTESDFHGIM